MSSLADRQLAAWQDIAATWRITLDGSVWRCADCGGGVMLDMDGQGRTYIWTPEQKTAQIVLHLRARHPEMDPDR